MKNEPTMNNYNEQMLEEVINGFSSVYSIYEKNIGTINSIDTTSTFSELRSFVADLLAVKTDSAREALCKKLDELIARAGEEVKKINDIVCASGKKFKELRTKMPLSKSEVDKILKTFNFRDYSKDETTDSGLFPAYVNIDGKKYSMFEDRSIMPEDAEDANNELDDDIKPMAQENMKETGIQAADEPTTSSEWTNALNNGFKLAVEGNKTKEKKPRRRKQKKASAS